jgi:hypothetical protein
MVSPHIGNRAGSSAPDLRGVWVALMLLTSVMIGATAGLPTWGALGQGVVLALFAGAGAWLLRRPSALACRLTGRARAARRLKAYASTLDSGRALA